MVDGLNDTHRGLVKAQWLNQHPWRVGLTPIGLVFQELRGGGGGGLAYLNSYISRAEGNSDLPPPKSATG